MNKDQSLVQDAVTAVNESTLSYCKFLSANDTGDTGAHQSGIYVAKNAYRILFDKEGIRGENKDKYVKIRWQNDFFTDSRFIYYGSGTRNEYRITRFGRGFPFLTQDHTGDLFVLVQRTHEDYDAFVLETEDDIDGFLDSFGMSPAETNSIIQTEGIDVNSKIDSLIQQFISQLNVDFPASSLMSSTARNIVSAIYGNQSKSRPDRQLIEWIEMEYNLFRQIEMARYSDMLNKGFDSVEEFVRIANKVLNRRKSRAGKSLENHLAAAFTDNDILFEEQCKTEGNKQPDFIFPDCNSYHNQNFPTDRLVFLGAKTTCKDRWRQIINEADRIPCKHLFTLQQGVSSRQIDEMLSERITLVVPAPYLSAFPPEKRKSILTLKQFMGLVKSKSL